MSEDPQEEVVIAKEDATELVEGVQFTGIVVEDFDVATIEESPCEQHAGIGVCVDKILLPKGNWYQVQLPCGYKDEVKLPRVCKANVPLPRDYQEDLMLPNGYKEDVQICKGYRDTILPPRVNDNMIQPLTGSQHANLLPWNHGKKGQNPNGCVYQDKSFRCYSDKDELPWRYGSVGLKPEDAEDCGENSIKYTDPEKEHPTPGKNHEELLGMDETKKPQIGVDGNVYEARGKYVGYNFEPGEDDFKTNLETKTIQYSLTQQEQMQLWDAILSAL